jgi:hypothetical protein
MAGMRLSIDDVVRRWNRFRWRRLDVRDQQIIVLHDHQALYFPIPKVACSSLKATCADLLGLTLPADTWKPDAFRRYHVELHTESRPLVIGRDQLTRYGGYWRFAFVRNPWDRLVSCFCEKIRHGDDEHFVNGVSKVLVPYGVFHPGMTFAKFVRAVDRIPDEVADGHLRSQHTFIADPSGSLIVDYLGRFESLEDDFQAVRQRLGAEISLPHLLPSQRRGYREYYDTTTRNLVARRYARDIQLFGYAF